MVICLEAANNRWIFNKVFTNSRDDDVQCMTAFMGAAVVVARQQMIRCPAFVSCRDRRVCPDGCWDHLLSDIWQDKRKEIRSMMRSQWRTLTSWQGSPEIEEGDKWWPIWIWRMIDWMMWRRHLRIQRYPCHLNHLSSRQTLSCRLDICRHLFYPFVVNSKLCIQEELPEYQR